VRTLRPAARAARSSSRIARSCRPNTELPMRAVTIKPRPR
jgi:hypothetical protein